MQYVNFMSQKAYFTSLVQLNNGMVIKRSDLELLLLLQALKQAQAQPVAPTPAPKVVPGVVNNRLNKNPAVQNIQINNKNQAQQNNKIPPQQKPIQKQAQPNQVQPKQPQAPNVSPFEKSKTDAINKIFNNAKNELGLTNVNKNAIAAEVNKLTPGQTHALNVNGQVYAVSNERNSSVVHVARQSLKPFNGGGFGKIFSMCDLDNPNDKSNILKLAYDNPKAGPNALHVARQDVLREPQILNYIHGNAPKVGVQAAPHKIVYLGAGANQKVGYLAKRYDMSGVELAHKMRMNNPFTKAQKETITNNLIKGLSSVHAAGVYHGDIKLENTLWGDNNLVLSDFGGAKKFSELFNKTSNLPNIFGAHTPNYLSQSIKSEVTSLVKNAQTALHFGRASNQQILNDMQQKITPLLKSNDKFALGVSLFKLWTSKDPAFFANAQPFGGIAQLNHAVNALKLADLDAKTKMSIMDLMIEGATPALKRHYQSQRQNIMARMQSEERI